MSKESTGKNFQAQSLILYKVALNYQEKGDFDQAKNLYRRILKINPNFLLAHQGLAAATLPGEDYITILKCFHDWLKPTRYVEIGVETGRSLALAQPPTIAVGIDPTPEISYEFVAPTLIYSMTSDAFFAAYDLLQQVGRSVIDLAFIDGSHLFEQVLKDFINIEKYAASDSVILIHDCLPLDKATSTRIRATHFWSGDTWKIIPCLKAYRPDLTIFTVATPPTGLGVVTNLDPTSTILQDNFEEITTRFIPLDDDYSESDRKALLNVIVNDGSLIQQRLESLRQGISTPKVEEAYENTSVDFA